MLDDVSPGTTNVSLADAINRSGVPRPSAYRVFGGGDDDPQTEFQLQLIERVIDDLPNILSESTGPKTAELIQRVNRVDQPLNQEELTQALVELIRQSAEDSVRFLSTNSRYGVFLSAMAMVRTSNCGRIETALNEMRAIRSAEFAVEFREWLSSFGLRLRQGWDEEAYYRSVNDATMGAILAAKGTTGGEAASVISWLAATYVAITALATEPDPRRIASAQPLEMLSVSPEQLLAST